MIVWLLCILWYTFIISSFFCWDLIFSWHSGELSRGLRLMKDALWPFSLVVAEPGSLYSLIFVNVAWGSSS